MRIKDWVFYGLVGLLLLCGGVRAAYADDTSIKVDTSPQAVEAAYQSVREGTAEKVVTLKDTAETMLVKLINAATATGEFIADQVPIVIKELLAYYAVSTAVWGFLGLIVLLYTWFTIIPWAHKYNSESDGFSYILVVIPSATGLVLLLPNLFEFLKITIAPRVWLIEYAASLVK